VSENEERKRLNSKGGKNAADKGISILGIR
jgi:hypothetical protein